jgi:hypothetical protein
MLELFPALAGVYCAAMTPGSRRIALVCFLALGGCAVVYEDDFPEGLETAPELEPTDELVFERELRWWIAPSRQRARLYLREDGSYLLVRQRWQGPEVYGWATGTLNDVGTAQLSNAFAVADPEDTAPVPGNYDCTYVDSLPATIHIDEESVTYPSLCPPAGLSELARVYGDVVELLLECPFDGSWYEDEVPLVGGECDVIE